MRNEPQSEVGAECQALIGKLEALEHVREQARRAGKWDEYSVVCEDLAQAGRLLWLTKKGNQ